MEGHTSLSILLVEDDVAAREILASVLSLRFPRLTIHVADNGKTGLECFERHTPAVVITDVNMPVMDGLRMARAIKAIMGGIKLVVLTAFSDKTILETSAMAGIGIDHYILKPLDYEKLFAVIEQCLAEVATDAEER